MTDFRHRRFIPPRCIYSFITLTPKVKYPHVVKDFRPISLIGMIYKTIAKTLANCVAKAVWSIVGVEQSTFIKGRQILDVPLLLNEVIS